MTTAVQVRVTGRVQGVAFRYYAEVEARRLGLVGWVRNEVDGSVLLHAEGPKDDVASMVEWCRHGSPAAQVRDVAVRTAAASNATSFEVTG